MLYLLEIEALFFDIIFESIIWPMGQSVSGTWASLAATLSAPDAMPQTKTKAWPQ